MDYSEEILKKIGDKLRELRIQKGYSSYETFAFDNDLPRMQYWRIEKGETNVTIKSLLKILNIHNTTLKDFFEDFI
ncbi:MAG: helix-turn-helix transcriptional regulator [Bacteroidales bacterium]|jgi:transcriptional regulator with XRE-family HTH domain|nr:helix-turn-helix transcriptional regulator [Bacteroidales bacterium]